MNFTPPICDTCLGAYSTKSPLLSELFCRESARFTLSSLGVCPQGGGGACVVCVCVWAAAATPRSLGVQRGAHTLTQPRARVCVCVCCHFEDECSAGALGQSPWNLRHGRPSKRRAHPIGVGAVSCRLRSTPPPVRHLLRPASAGLFSPKAELQRCEIWEIGDRMATLFSSKVPRDRFPPRDRFHPKVRLLPKVSMPRMVRRRHGERVCRLCASEASLGRRTRPRGTTARRSTCRASPPLPYCSRQNRWAAPSRGSRKFRKSSWGRGGSTGQGGSDEISRLI